MGMGGVTSTITITALITIITMTTITLNLCTLAMVIMATTNTRQSTRFTTIPMLCSIITTTPFCPSSLGV